MGLQLLLALDENRPQLDDLIGPESHLSARRQQPAYRSHAPLPLELLRLLLAVSWGRLG